MLKLTTRWIVRLFKHRIQTKHKYTPRYNFVTQNSEYRKLIARIGSTYNVPTEITQTIYNICEKFKMLIIHLSYKKKKDIYK